MHKFVSLTSLALAAALVTAPAAAQPKGRAPAKAPEPPPPATSPIFPCRTAEEICFLGIVVGGKLAVIYTNAPGAEAIDEKPLDVAGPDGAKLDLSKEDGRVVMMTGALDPKAGLTKAAVIEVASPLQSLAIKGQLAAGAAAEAAPGKPAPTKRR